MKIIPSSNGLTTKYIHNDGSETSFKKSFSGKYHSTDLENPILTDKQKYSLVISCSKGCQMKCQFCHLTQKESHFQSLSSQQVEDNLKNVISESFKSSPEISNKYIKLCWMGEGEAILKPEMIYTVSINVISWAIQNGYAKGLDGIDIATSMPKVSTKVWTGYISKLVEETKDFERNPMNTEDRTLIRLFYSLHSANQFVRDQLIPNTKTIDKAIKELKNVSETYNIDLVFHYMFMNNINDSSLQVNELLDLYKKYDLVNNEIRILRYNSGTNGITESDNIASILNHLEQNINKLKIQHSSGNSIASACGMFIVDKKTDIAA